MLREKCANIIELHLHRVIQRVELLSSEDRKTEDTRTACREHRTVLDHRRAVNDKHRHTAFSRPLGNDTHKRFLLVGRRPAVKENPRHLLSRRPR